MIGQKFEDVGTNRLSVIGRFGFDGEQQVNNAGRDEADEKRAVVDHDALKRR